MGRYLGPRVRVLRALGCELPGLTRKTVGDRTASPGQHGASVRRKSEFGQQLIEKQKLRYHYGVNEGQLRNLLKQAKRSKTPTGEKLIELLELRLDNMVFRAGFAPSIVAARQLVRHGHVLLNGRRVDVPAQRLRIGDCLGLKPSAMRIPAVQEVLAAPVLARPDWLSPDADNAAAMRLNGVPPGDAQPFAIEMQKVVEYYSTRA